MAGDSPRVGETCPRCCRLAQHIIDVFDQMNQRMLILGEPGAGKTTLLLELARELIKRADENADSAQPGGVQSLVLEPTQSAFGRLVGR